MDRDRVIIARIGAPHGVRGEVRLKSWAEVPRDVAAYGPLAASDGRSFEIEAIRPAAGKQHDMFVVRLKGVADRDAAAALNGTELTVGRDVLPPAGDDEYYLADLIGLDVVDGAGAPLGTILSVANYGAGDLLEIARDTGAPVLLPFTKANVPTVDLAVGRVVAQPPPGYFDDDGIVGLPDDEGEGEAGTT